MAVQTYVIEVPANASTDLPVSVSVPFLGAVKGLVRVQNTMAVPVRAHVTLDGAAMFVQVRLERTEEPAAAKAAATVGRFLGVTA